ncbi:cadherin-like beta sandwich domain-containing protein, partial [Mucilaginibacter sp. OK098]|uniref:cadherin-like beta sandwich domain-containing protein n=1 Tax=Mucilaginibacter sp. OK098 TaxID=1855297 RepID=UPI0009139BE5
LPAGLNFDENTGIISGTPTAASPATNYTVTAYNSSGSTFATLNIKVNSAPPLSTLANLVLSSGTLAPSFASGTFNYTASVVNTVTSIKVTPTTSSPTATVTVNGTTVASGSVSASIPLALGANAITVVVTAAGGISTNTYTVNVTRVPPANTTLSNITLSTGTLSPAFASTTNSYVDSVSYSTSSITLTPTTSDPTSTVTVNGTAVTSGSPSAAISLTPGTNPVSVVVTASDGITTTTYTVFVTSPSVVFSYSSPHTYSTANTITPLAPTVSGTVAAPAYSSSFVTIATGFSAPSGVAVDAAGNVYVADQGNNAIKKIPAGGGSPVTIGSGFIDPFCVAVDAAGNVYVGDHSSAGIKKIPVGGGAPVILGSGLNEPVGGVAVDGAGNIYVGDRGNNAVKEIPVSGGAPITLASGFTPYGVAVDAAGNIYVGDYTNSEVKKIPAGGGTLVIIGSGLDQPIGVAVDASGNVYVGGGGAVREIPVTGGSTILLNSSFNGPAGVAVDRKGNVYVADEFNNAVEKIKPVGGYYIGPFLPAGLSFNNTTGVISGTPTVSNPATNYFITAYNSSGSGSATVNIKVANIGLSGLALSSGILSPTFATETNSYTAIVPAATTSITETPTSSTPSATITVNGTTVASGTASASIPLALGANIITTVVTAAGGTGTNTYTVKVGRGSADALLTSIHLTPATTLTLVSGPSYLNYTAKVPAATSSITVTATEQDATATLKINGITVTSGAESPSIPLSIGNNVINIVSTAQDGVTTNTYSIKVTRQEQAVLTTLTLNPTAPSYAIPGPDFRDYRVSVANSVSSVTLTPTAADAGTTITVNNVAVASGTASGSIPLNVGDNTITTVATGQDGVTTKTYSILIIRLAPAVLTTLTLNPAAPLYAIPGPDYRDYRVSVGNSVSSVTLTPVSPDATTTITVNNVAVASGTASGSIPLNVGNNTITTVATAQDGVTTNTYSILVIRQAPAVLTTLALNPATTLSVVTGPDYRDYKAIVANSVSSVTLTPTSLDATTTITVNNVSVASGTASGAIPLNVGDNTITTVATAQDGVTANTYSIKVTRQAPVGFVSLYDDKQTVPVTVNEVVVHQNVSPNGDGKSDYLLIDGITAYPNNTLQIMSRNGTLVYETKSYDNISKVFDGHSNTNGKLQQAGTYFYSLDYTVNGKNKHKTGYIILKY